MINRYHIANGLSGKVSGNLNNRYLLTYFVNYVSFLLLSVTYCANFLLFYCEIIKTVKKGVKILNTDLTYSYTYVQRLTFTANTNKPRR